jgi:hypothetical protein
MVAKLNGIKDYQFKVAKIIDQLRKNSQSEIIPDSFKINLVKSPKEFQED